MLDAPTVLRRYEAACASPRADRFPRRWIGLMVALRRVARTASGDYAVLLADRARDCGHRARYAARIEASRRRLIPVLRDVAGIEVA